MSERELFLAVVDAPDAERDGVLSRLCGDDSPLRDRMRVMLDAHSRSENFLLNPPWDELVETILSQRDGTANDVPGIRAASKTEWEVSSLLAPSDEPGSLGRLDHYEVREIVGRGGMGVVLKGVDTRLARTVAIKVMSPELAMKPEAVERFRQEA